MATRDWSALDWGTWVAPQPWESALPQGSALREIGGYTGLNDVPQWFWDKSYNIPWQQQNEDLFRSMGYTGTGSVDVVDPEFGGTTKKMSPDLYQWMKENGIGENVGHDPGTSPGGRPEYFGYFGKDGKYLAGQADPVMHMSDTLMDNITPFLMMAGPFLNATGVIGQGAGAAGAGSGATSTSGGLGAAADGVTKLGAAWSPEALGLTLAPSTAGAEIAAIGSTALPGAVGSLGAAGGVTALGAGMSPAGLGLTGTITPAITSTELAALGAGIPGAVGPTASIGASAGLSGADKAALYGAEGYGPGMTGAQTTAYDGVLGVTGSKGLANLAANSGLGSAIVNGASKLAGAVGGGTNLAGLIGAGLGAASGGGGNAQVSSRDPWAEAQPFLKNLLSDADAMRANLKANPFTTQQTQAYNNAYNGLDQARQALPGLLSWGQNAMTRQSTVPSYQQLFGGGLLGQQPPAQPAGPTMQAGGPGGLLMDPRLYR